MQLQFTIVTILSVLFGLGIPGAHGLDDAFSTTKQSSTEITTVTSNEEWTPVEQEFDGVTMVLVPAGCFTIGSTDDDLARLAAIGRGNSIADNEMNGNELCFEPFWLDKTEVTQAQFAANNGVQALDNSFVGDNHPVDSLTWFEARDYCVTRGGRLPTEAEWEYAARGPDGLMYPWGDENEFVMAVHRANSRGETSEVGRFPEGVSWVGALDMSGNVWEWVSSLGQLQDDRFRVIQDFLYPYDSTDGREEDTGDAINVRRVLRGGSWDTVQGRIRSAYRNHAQPDSVGDGYGVRCARSQEAE